MNQGPPLQKRRHKIRRTMRLPHQRRHVFGHPMGGRRSQVFPVIKVQRAIGGRTQPHRLFEDRVEHRCEVAGRGIDDLQDLGGRGLLLQRLARFGQQPRILDRDHRLVGKGLQQRDLRFGKRLDLASPAADDPDRFAVAHDRYAEKRAISRDRLQYLEGARVVAGLVQRIGDMRRPGVDKSASHGKIGQWRPWEQGMKCGRLLRRHAVHRDEVEQPVLKPRDSAELGGADLGRAPDDDLEHRLHIGGRTRDDAEDRARRGLARAGRVALGFQGCQLASKFIEPPFERRDGVGRAELRVSRHLASDQPPAARQLWPPPAAIRRRYHSRGGRSYETLKPFRNLKALAQP